jgi:hypothetical protein
MSTSIARVGSISFQRFSTSASNAENNWHVLCN